MFGFFLGVLSFCAFFVLVLLVFCFLCGWGGKFCLTVLVVVFLFWLWNYVTIFMISLSRYTLQPSSATTSAITTAAVCIFAVLWNDPQHVVKCAHF